MDYLLQGCVNALRLLFSGDPATVSAILTTVKVSSMSVAASVILGVPCGFLLGHCRFPLRKAVRTLVETLLAFPTVVIGLLVYAMLSRQGPFGQWGLLFTLPGIAVGQTLLGLPTVIALTAAAVEGLDRRLTPTLLTLGAGRPALLWTTIREAQVSLLAASLTAYGRIVSEVGISMMVGGNIKWHTRTLTTAIALETGKGEFASGIALGIVLLGIAFAVNVGLSFLKRKSV
jgi:tungstate transport system permease protein